MKKQPNSNAAKVDLPRLVRAKIERRLARAAALIEEALELAEGEGWPDAVGFISGEGPSVTISVIESQETRLAQNSSPPEHLHVCSSARGWDCGAW